MKKMTLLLVLLSLFNLHAQEGQAPLPEQAVVQEADPDCHLNEMPIVQEESLSQEAPVYVSPIAAQQQKKEQSTAFTNWLFAGSALVTAAIGVIAVAVNAGSNAP